MSGTEDFLRLVLPAAGVKFLAVPYPSGHGFGHTSFTDLESMAAAAGDMSEEGQNVYFALAGFHAPYVEEADADGNVKRRFRTQSNVAVLRSLWVDLDVKEGNGYASQQEAIADLVRFVRAAGLPVPTIVNSGGGIHAYWPLDQDVPRASWKQLAAVFKAVTVAMGLKADPVRTADEASVLRVPGTVNRKPGRPPRPVSLVGGLTQPIPVVAFATAVRRAFDDCGATLAKEPAKKVTGVNADLIGGTEPQYEPADSGRIVGECQQVRIIASTRGDVAEPVWYAGLQLARHCIDAEQLAHDWSDGHPSYDEAATDRKLEQLRLRGVGPTTCARFDSLNPGVCAGCPHFGKITSPVQLGRGVEEVPPAPLPTLTVSGIEFELPEPPTPFIRTASGQIAMMQLDEDGEPMDPILIYRYDLYPVSRYYDEFERRFHTRFRTYQPKRGWYEFDVPNEVLYDTRTMAKTLANADVLPAVGAVKYIGDYLVSYTQKLQELTDAVNLFAQMGWRDDDTKFVLGDKLLTHDGVKSVAASTISHKAAEKFVTAGSFETWRDVVSYYSQPGNEPLLFGFLTAFGAPLFRFTGFSGAIINMMGPSGTGKSTVLRAVNTVYGAPDCAFFQLMDTEKSFYRRVGVLNNLPIAFDEITNIEAKRLSDLCYDFTQGRERMRLTSNATERRDTFGWKTLMLSSANASLHARLSGAKVDASAESVRVFEYSVATATGDALDVKRRFDLLSDNYGHAGAIYVQTLLGRLDEVKDRIAALTERIYAEAKLPSSERFWAAIIAANLTGGGIAKELGLVSFDEEAMLRWALRCIQEMRGVVQEFRRGPIDILSGWLGKLVPHTLVIQGSPQRPNVPSACALPRGELKARYDKTAGLIYLPRITVLELCREDGVDVTTLRKELSQSGVLVRQERKVLGAGTDFQTGQVNCWVIDVRNPQMDGGAAELERAGEGAQVAPLTHRKAK